ncbi:superoxide dismutase family protein [Phenylobacterium sp.]|uniref:superoxide dismutase[Cu-Zn] n=1 Tax=Phenylobacterium sp. TaxID=1871053 RepID=UPI0035B3EF8E
MKILPLALALATVASTAASAADFVEFQLKTNAGESAGMAKVTESPKGVILHIEAKGLPPGWHGMHFHEKGDCSKSDFTSAGGHVHAMTPVVHGLLNPQANDSGDLPNLFVAADGTASAELFSPFVSLRGAGGRPALLDADGSALIIHAQPDDYTTQPIGGAGARVACGAIISS